MPRAQKKQLSYRHRAGDKTSAQVWMTPAERAQIEAAADADMRSMTQILLRGGLLYAEEILEKTRKTRKSVS